MTSQTSDNDAVIEMQGLTMAYGPKVVQKDLNFSVRRGETFIIMGGSGCGKSTLMRHMVGLNSASEGRVLLFGEDVWNLPEKKRAHVWQRMGVMYQAGALWSSMTLAENVALPLRYHTKLSDGAIKDVVALRLAMVGLAGFEEYYPAEISGGMQKRASIARALALDPDILFLDEPSAGLDPITSRKLDELLISLRENLGMTLVIVTHELDSILSIGTDSVYLDAETKTMIAQGDPKQLKHDANHPKVMAFLNRGEVKEHAV